MESLGMTLLLISQLHGWDCDFRWLSVLSDPGESEEKRGHCRTTALLYGHWMCSPLGVCLKEQGFWTSSSLSLWSSLWNSLSEWKRTFLVGMVWEKAYRLKIFQNRAFTFKGYHLSEILLSKIIWNEANILCTGNFKLLWCFQGWCRTATKENSFWVFLDPLMFPVPKSVSLSSCSASVLQAWA